MADEPQHLCVLLSHSAFTFTHMNSLSTLHAIECQLSLLFTLLYTFLLTFFHTLPLPGPAQALERQKEYTDAIRIERDELREEVVTLKDILKVLSQCVVSYFNLLWEVSVAKLKLWFLIY